MCKKKGDDKSADCFICMKEKFGESKKLIGHCLRENTPVDK